jgi:putative colanic acid biosynthesis UDP-glucose lipid carrier transferase
LRVARERGHNYRRTAIVGSTEVAVQLAEEISRAPWMGLHFAGYYDDRKPADMRVADAISGQIRGTVEDLVAEALAGQIDRIYITLPLRAELRIKHLIDRLGELPVTVHYVPDFFLFNMLRAQWEHLGDTHVVNVVATPFLGVSGLTKRLEDIVLSSLILTLIALPLLVIAILIRIDSPGPAIYRQRRYGLNGKEFEIWKFRSMTVTEDSKSFVQARPGDVRVTRLGSFLRRTSLDELPQFLNVLRGDMSIVGPRPHPVALDEQHRKLIPQYYFRHKIRPGITGLAQINGFRGPTDTLDKMRGRIEHDIRYIDHWSLGLDIRIVLMTVLRGFVHHNAL